MASVNLACNRRIGVGSARSEALDPVAPCASRIDHTQTLAREDFSIASSSLESCELLTLRGDLDLVSAPQLIETIDALVDSSPVVIDLTRVEFIDSSGIHALLRPSPQRGRIALVCPEGNVRRVLSLAHVQRVLRMYDSVEAAVAGLGC
jgi:anti-sigma B factor antagonist